MAGFTGQVGAGGRLEVCVVRELRPGLDGKEGSIQRQKPWPRALSRGEAV